VEGLDELKQRLERVDGSRAEAFAELFLTSHDSLITHARRDLPSAVRRLRDAQRCTAMLEGMGNGPLAAYPDHWLRLVEAAQIRLRSAVSLLQRVQGLSPPLRRTVTTHPRVQTWARAAVEMIRVTRLVFASAGDALLGLVLGEMAKVDQLAETLLHLTHDLALLPPAAAAAASGAPSPPLLPTVEEIRAAVASSFELEDDGGAATSLDPRLVCNLTLIPLSISKSLGVPVTHFSGAPYFAPCCNLWLNTVSLETPQPDNDDSPF
jgi:hypothetical protein